MFNLLSCLLVVDNFIIDHFVSTKIHVYILNNYYQLSVYKLKHVKLLILGQSISHSIISITLLTLCAQNLRRNH